MFLNLNTKDPKKLAAIDDCGQAITYGEIIDFSLKFKNTLNSRSLLFILSENSIGSLAGFIASLLTRNVPLLLSALINKSLLETLINIYKPSFFWAPINISAVTSYKLVFTKYNYGLYDTSFDPIRLHDDLSFLLPTSGSTGSPKLVRHSYTNIESSAANVALFFGLTSNDRPLAMLPMHYTMGLSVITSHLYTGATILLSKGNLTDKAFWDYFKENKATSFTGVPFSYEILYRLRFTRMALPDLKLITQGGGKLNDDLFKHFAQYARETGRRFIATYGQTEGTARMAYLPEELAIIKTGSIGRAIPGGKLWLIDEKGKEIHDLVASGQLVYEGSNVTMGYANTAIDLLIGDENCGVLHTGDIARRDIDGCYYIIGRLKRFLKLYGLRISLDEVENLVNSEFKINCMCSGDDNYLKVYITDQCLKESIKSFISEKTGLYHNSILVDVVSEIKRNEAGKPIYN